MFARVYSLFFFLFCALPVFAGATILPRGGGGGDGGIVNSCNTGPIQCCNSQNLGTAQSLGVTGLLGLLGIVVDPITAILGINCTPITVVGTGGNSCSAQPVCCTNNEFSGLISIGCSPITINL